MATDNTSDISENDIIVAFELKNNSNPLAIYLEYQSKFWTEYPWFRMRVSWTGPGLGHIGVQKWNELEGLGLELNHPCLALNLQCRIKQLFEITKTKLYRRYCIDHRVQISQFRTCLISSSPYAPVTGLKYPRLYWVSYQSMTLGLGFRHIRCWGRLPDGHHTSSGWIRYFPDGYRR